MSFCSGYKWDCERSGNIDETRPVGSVPFRSAEVRADDDDADWFWPGTIEINLGNSLTQLRDESQDSIADLAVRPAQLVLTIGTTLCLGYTLTHQFTE